MGDAESELAARLDGSHYRDDACSGVLSLLAIQNAATPQIRARPLAHRLGLLTLRRLPAPSVSAR